MNARRTVRPALRRSVMQWGYFWEGTDAALVAAGVVTAEQIAVTRAKGRGHWKVEWPLPDGSRAAIRARSKTTCHVMVNLTQDTDPDLLKRHRAELHEQERGERAAAAAREFVSREAVLARIVPEVAGGLRFAAQAIEGRDPGTGEERPFRMDLNSKMRIAEHLEAIERLVRQADFELLSSDQALRSNVIQFPGARARA